MRFSFLLDDKCKFIANVKEKDHKSPKYSIVETFECYIKHSNVATFEGSFECRTFIHALLVTSI